MENIHFILIYQYTQHLALSQFTAWLIKFNFKRLAWGGAGRGGGGMVTVYRETPAELK